MAEAAEPKRIHAKGAIVRIKVKDFLTYGEVEVHPNPGLNVIIGPNGNGKSSLVNAVGLGLGGDPSIIGRAPKVADYIKENAPIKEAYILIELCVPGGKNCVVERVITETNSTFKINGQSKSRVDVIKYMKDEFRIQVDNMCQYLPQDKVSEFAKMNPQDLLRSTQEAVCAPQMAEDYKQLIETRKSIRAIEVSYANNQGRMDEEEAACKELEKAAEAHNERKKVQESLDNRRKKLPWMRFRNANANYKLRKEDAKKAEAELAKAHDKTRPLEDKKDRMKVEQANINAEFSKNTQALRGQQTAMQSKTTSLDKFDEDIDNVEANVVAKENDMKAWRKKVEDTQKMLDANQQQLQELEQRAAENEPQIVDVNAQLDQTSSALADITAKIDTKSHETNDAENEIRGLQNELNRLGNVETKKLDKMRRDDDVTYKAYLWLKDNRDKFSKPVYGPIGYEIEIKNAKHAKYVENLIGKNDRRMFICENYDDYNLFQREVRNRLNLPANYGIVPDEPLNSFRPQVSLDKIKHLGFYAHVGDMFECPETVRRYLYKSTNAFNVPVGDHTSENCMEAIGKIDALRTFFTENRRYAITISRYGDRQKSSRSNELTAPTFFTKADKGNEDRAAHCKNTIKQLQGLNGRRNEEVAKLREELDGIQRQTTELREELSSLQLPTKRIREMRTVHSKNIRTMDDLKASKVDMDDVRKKAEASVQKILKDKVLAITELDKLIKACFDLYTQRMISSIRHSAITRKIAKIDADMHAINGDLERHKQAHQAAEDEAKRQKELTRRHHEDACRTCGIPLNSQLPDYLIKIFGTFPDREDQLEEEINKFATELECTMATDEAVVREFEKRSKKLRDFRAEVIRSGTELERMKTELIQLRDGWLPQLEELVDKINVRFMDLFKKMSCAGEIAICKGDNEDDFDLYGIGIKVRFRDNEKLQVLTSYTQSGGEKSVTTVLYIMALQELSQVPFRCVDEINQGMDAHNERRIFDLVVSTASKENTSQYFLLTPKLLPDMDFGRNAKIMCVYKNCSFMNRQFNIDEFSKKMTKARQGSE